MQIRIRIPAQNNLPVFCCSAYLFVFLDHSEDLLTYRTGHHHILRLKKKEFIIKEKFVNIMNNMYTMYSLTSNLVLGGQATFLVPNACGHILLLLVLLEVLLGGRHCVVLVLLVK